MLTNQKKAKSSDQIKGKPVANRHYETDRPHLMKGFDVNKHENFDGNTNSAVFMP